MMRILFLLVSVIFFLSLAKVTHGQVAAKDIERWSKLLSVKKDLRWENYFRVVEDVKKIDSVDQCRALQQLGKEGAVNNKRFLIRYYCLLNSYSFAYTLCHSEEEALGMVKRSLQMAYELEDLYLIELSNKTIADIYRQSNQIGTSRMHRQIAIDAQEQLGLQNFPSVAFDRYVMGDILYHSREYNDCIRMIRQALHYERNPNVKTLDTINNTSKMFLFNTLGLAYEKVLQYDSAFWAFDQALVYAKNTSNTAWQELIEGNRGDVFYDLGQYDSAKVLLQKDLDKSLEGGKLWADNAAISMQKLARIHVYENKPQQAIPEFRRAAQYLQLNPKPHVLAQIYYGYMLAFEKLGRADSVLAYTLKYQTLHDSLERIASDFRTEIVQMRLDNQAGIHKILALNKEKKRIALIRNFILLLTLFATIIGFLYINRQRLKMKLRHQHVLEEKSKAETEAKEALNQLHVFTQNMLEKTNLVEKLQEQLMEKELTEIQVHYIQELSQHTILTDDDWDNFKNLFDKVYPGFLIQLKTKAPDITLAEIRTAALVRLQVTSKEAAHLLGISPNSVNKTKQRLRYRLDLDPECDLEAYFSTT